MPSDKHNSRTARARDLISSLFNIASSIDNVPTSNSGTYMCAVTNPIGSDNRSMTVNVLGMYANYTVKI